jgi:hypothetical protein
LIEANLMVVITLLLHITNDMRASPTGMKSPAQPCFYWSHRWEKNELATRHSLVSHITQRRGLDLSAMISGTRASSFSSFVYCFRPPGQLAIWSRHWGRPNKDGQKDGIMPSDATSFHACLSCYGELARLHLASESAQLYAFNFTQRIPKSYKILSPWSSYTFKLLFRFMDGSK